MRNETKQQQEQSRRSKAGAAAAEEEVTPALSRPLQRDMFVVCRSQGPRQRPEIYSGSKNPSTLRLLRNGRLFYAILWPLDDTRSFLDTAARRLNASLLTNPLMALRGAEGDRRAQRGSSRSRCRAARAG